MSTPENRSSTEVRREIERTRADMDETIDALEERLSPRELVDQAWRYVKRDGRGVTDVLRDHPVPAALMGLGVAWLAIEQATGDRDREAYSRGSETSGLGESDEGDAEGTVARMKRKASEAVDTVRDTAEDVADRARSTADSAKDRLGSARSGLGEIGGRAGETAGRTGEKVRQKATDAGDRARSFMHDSPLASGAVAFGLGLASGLAVPSTPVEDRLMGEKADQLKHTAAEEGKRMGKQTASVVSDAAHAAKDEAGRQGMGDQLQESARKIGSEAKRAAKERAEQENLDPAGLQQRARDAADEVREPRRR